MEIGLKGVVVIVGGYGSGKTEVAINLAVNQKRRGAKVRVADLDLVNFYFRTREAKHYLADLGIDLVLPPKQYMNADLPILAPEVAGMIRHPAELTLLDVGGDDAGATVLASLADAFSGRPYRMLQVVNPFRPNTATMAGCLKIQKEIEAASGMTIDGIIGNANLIDETTHEVVQQGYVFVSALSDHTGLPLEFITASTDLLPQLDTASFGCPILAIDRRLSMPWTKKQMD
ncbi:MAG: cobalamin biosynthesis protein CbiA [Desulfobacterales bacterium]|jgi:hypothetical protein|nr:cobalamin biosynthesis protein CbiA [Desulfobacterales bacterium]